MSKFTRILEQIVTLGQGERLLRLTTHQIDMKCVAAGDPSLPCLSSDIDKALPSTVTIDGQQVAIADFEPFKVCGNSMFPQNIADGNILLVSQLPSFEYQEGDFLVIRVDPYYYKKYNPKSTFYDYKLRKALLRIEVGVDDHELIARLKEHDYTAYLDKMQQYAVKKYRKAREAYPDKELMLSMTYHDGDLKYSFHPVDLIYGRADVLLSNNKKIFLRAA